MRKTTISQGNNHGHPDTQLNLHVNIYFLAFISSCNIAMGKAKIDCEYMPLPFYSKLLANSLLPLTDFIPSPLNEGKHLFPRFIPK